MNEALTIAAMLRGVAEGRGPREARSWGAIARRLEREPTAKEIGEARRVLFTVLAWEVFHGRCRHQVGK